MAKIRIAVNHLCNDMIIGEDVYNKSGVVLVAQGSIVTDEVISLLSRHLIDSVAIEYQAAADEPQQAENAQPLVDEKQYQEFQEHFSVAENMLSDNLKKFENKRYILTTKKMNYQIVKKFALELRPIELNVIMNNEGEGIYLYDSSNPIKNNEHISKIDLLSYKYKIHSLLAILNKIGIYSLFCLFIRRIIKRK